MTIRLNRLRSLEDFQEYCFRFESQRLAHLTWMRDRLKWKSDQGETRFKAFSYPVGRKQPLIVTRQWVNGQWVINHRESFVCPKTGLNNRMRASIHMMDLEANLYPDSRIF